MGHCGTLWARGRLLHLGLFPTRLDQTGSKGTDAIKSNHFNSPLDPILRQPQFCMSPKLSSPGPSSSRLPPCSSLATPSCQFFNLASLSGQPSPDLASATRSSRLDHGGDGEGDGERVFTLVVKVHRKWLRLPSSKSGTNVPL